MHSDWPPQSQVTVILFCRPHLIICPPNKVVKGICCVSASASPGFTIPGQLGMSLFRTRYGHRQGASPILRIGRGAWRITAAQVCRHAGSVCSADSAAYRLASPCCTLSLSPLRLPLSRSSHGVHGYVYCTDNGQEQRSPARRRIGRMVGMAIGIGMECTAR